MCNDKIECRQFLDWYQPNTQQRYPNYLKHLSKLFKTVSFYNLSIFTYHKITLFNQHN